MKRLFNFLASVIKKGRRRLQMQLALNNRTRFLNFVCLILSLITKGTLQFLIQFVPVISFFKIHLFCYHSKTSLAAHHRTACFSTCYTLIAFKYRSGLCISSKYISCSRSKRNTSSPLPAILFQKI